MYSPLHPPPRLREQQFHFQSEITAAYNVEIKTARPTLPPEMENYLRASSSSWIWKFTKGCCCCSLRFANSIILFFLLYYTLHRGTRKTPPHYHFSSGTACLKKTIGFQTYRVWYLVWGEIRGNWTPGLTWGVVNIYVMFYGFFKFIWWKVHYTYFRNRVAEMTIVPKKNLILRIIILGS